MIFNKLKQLINDRNEKKSIMIQEELEKNRIELPFEEVEKLFLDGCITKEDFESYLDKDRLFYT